MLNLEPNKRGSSPTDFIKRNKTGPARSLETQKGRKKGKQDYNNVCSHEPICHRTSPAKGKPRGERAPEPVARM
jgi:hypothetical protein